MAPTIEQLEAMSEEDLRRRYNERTDAVGEGPSWYHDELQRRRADKQARSLIFVSWCIAALTAANLIFIAVSIFE